jgi:hypothetical protein
MIDYLKISTTDFDYKSLFSSEIFKFKGWTDLETNEIQPNRFGNKKYECYLFNLKVIIYENSEENFTLCILGSIHKFFNNGPHNKNDFSFNDINSTIERLSKLLFFNPDTCIIHNLEIGLNVIPKVRTNKILKGLLLHKGKRFKSYSFDNADYYQVIHHNYFIKVYDKAKQYRAKGFIIPNEILRVELKYKKMNDLVKMLNESEIINKDFISLSDLNNVEVLKAFGELLLKKWNKILFYDYTISKRNLSKPQRRKLDIWQNINQWEQFSKQKKYKEKLKLQEVIKNHSQKLQFQVSNLIQEKLEILLPKGLPINHFDNIKKDDQLTNIEEVGVDIKRLPSNSIYKEEFSLSFEDFFLNDKNKNILKNYEVWINDPREILF